MGRKRKRYEEFYGDECLYQIQPVYANEEEDVYICVELRKDMMAKRYTTLKEWIDALFTKLPEYKEGQEIYSFLPNEKIESIEGCVVACKVKMRNNNIFYFIGKVVKRYKQSEFKFQIYSAGGYIELRNDFNYKSLKMVVLGVPFLTGIEEYHTV